MSKRKSVRIMSLLLSIVMFVVIFTACQKTDPPKTSSTQGSSTSAGEIADPLGKYKEPVTITVSRIFDATTKFDSSNPDFKSYEDNIWIRTFKERLNIDVKFKWIATDKDADSSKWNAAMASGDLPDTAAINQNTWVTLLAGGKCADMTQTFDQYASDLYKSFIKNGGQDQYDYTTVDGKLRGLPFTYGAYQTTPMCFIRKDWLDKLKLPVPTTLDELIKVAEAFKSNKLGGENTYGFGWEGDFTLRAFSDAYGIHSGFWNDDGKGGLVYGDVTDTYKTVLLKLKDVYSKGLIKKDFSVNSTIKEDLTNGLVGIVYGPLWYGPVTLQSNYNSDPKAEWMAIWPPSSTGKRMPLSTDAKREMVAFVNKDSKHPEAVVKMLNLYTELLVNDYDKYGTAPDGRMVFKYAPMDGLGSPMENVDKHKACIQALKQGNTNGITNGLNLGNANRLLKAQTDRSLAGWKVMYGTGECSYKYLMEAMDSKLLATDKFTTLPTQTMTLVQRTINDTLVAAYKKVITGADISVYDNAIKQWNSSGGKDITDEVNKWYKSKKK